MQDPLAQGMALPTIKMGVLISIKVIEIMHPRLLPEVRLTGDSRFCELTANPSHLKFLRLVVLRGQTHTGRLLVPPTPTPLAPQSVTDACAVRCLPGSPSPSGLCTPHLS